MVVIQGLFNVFTEEERQSKFEFEFLSINAVRDSKITERFRFIGLVFVLGFGTHKWHITQKRQMNGLVPPKNLKYDQNKIELLEGFWNKGV